MRAFTLFSFFSVALALPEFYRDAPSADWHADGSQPNPGPINNTSLKLVHDAQHKYKAPGKGDQRGPCPGLNALANHGYLPHNGVATPAQIVTAVQEGFNMGWDIATFLAYGAFLANGNQVTNLMSIGGRTITTGPAPPRPATAGGLDVHGNFEGDASLTRSDDQIGDNHNFNETLFEELLLFVNTYGSGAYNVTVAAEFRHARIQDSIKANPEFKFTGMRYLTGYGETVLPILLFIDGRDTSGRLDRNALRQFLQHGRYPSDFHRRASPATLKELNALVADVFTAHPWAAGYNRGAVNSYVKDETMPFFTDSNFACVTYVRFVENVIVKLYPNPKGNLKEALRVNMNTYFQAFSGMNCTQLYPFGQ